MRFSLKLLNASRCSSGIPMGLSLDGVECSRLSDCGGVEGCPPRRKVDRGMIMCEEDERFERRGEVRGAPAY